MYKVEREQKIMWKLNPTVFEVINRDVMYSVGRPLGSSVSATKAMTASVEEMRYYMPAVTGASPDNSSVNWQNVIESYWHDFSIDISESGTTLDTSLLVEYQGRFKTAIDEYYKAKGKKLPDGIAAIEEAVGELLIATTDLGHRVIPEVEVYKYATPSNMEQYLAWRYCLVSSQVANRPEDIDKSANIRFYIHDENLANKKKAEIANVSKRAFKLYNDLISSTRGGDKATYGDILLVHGGFTVDEIKKMTLEDTQLEVSKMTVVKPATLIGALEDKLIADKARILKYIRFGLLRKLDNSEAIIDATTLIPVGNNLLDAVTYFLNKDNEAYVAEMKAKYSAINK